MSLQWTIVAMLLYIELFFLSLLMLPWIRSNLWSKIFKSRAVRGLQTYSHVYVWAGAGILLLFFFDAIREVRKYSSSDTSVETHPNAEAIVHMRLFRAQRNLYISGFALFLWFVIRRMVGLLSREAQLQAGAEAALKQAQGATDAANAAMDNSNESEAMKSMKQKMDIMSGDLQKAEKDRDAMKSQSDNLKTEYDRVSELLQNAEKGEKTGDKKSD